MRVLYASYLNAEDSKAAKAAALYTLKYLSRHLDATYYDSTSRASLKQLLISLGIDSPLHTYHIPLPQTNSKIIDQANRIVYFVAVLFHTLLHSYDVIYTTDLSFAFLWSITPRFLKPKIKIVFESHKIYFLTSTLVSRNREKQGYRVVDHFIATTEACKSDLHHIFHIPLNKIDVLRNGIDNDLFDRQAPETLVPEHIKKAYGIPNNAIVVTYAGSLKPWKGVEVFLEASRSIPQSTDIAFLIIGGTDKEVSELKQRYPQIVFTGYVDKLQLVRLLSISSIGVIPNSLSVEGLRYTCPMKLFDYMKAGLPIISAALPSIKEIISSPGNALFFTPEKPRELAEVIQSLSNNSLLQQQIVEANRILVRGFSWENKAVALKTILLRLMPCML